MVMVSMGDGDGEHGSGVMVAVVFRPTRMPLTFLFVCR
jgi:hypothetical protein